MSDLNSAGKVLSSFAANNNVSIHYLEFNPGDDRLPLVIVPGMINSAEEVVEVLSPHLDRRTIILSLRGRGKSDSPEAGYTMEDQASDIVAVADHLGLQSFVLFGHSTGGSIAARSLPMLGERVKAIVLGDFPPYYPQYSQQWADHIKSEVPEKQISDLALNGIVGDAVETKLAPLLAQSSANKVLIKGGQRSSLLKDEVVEKMKEFIPGLEVEALPNAGHDFLDEDPEGTMEVLSKVSLWSATPQYKR